MHMNQVVTLVRGRDNCMLGFCDIRVNSVQEFNGRIRRFFSYDIRINCVEQFNGRSARFFLFRNRDCSECAFFLFWNRDLLLVIFCSLRCCLA